MICHKIDLYLSIYIELYDSVFRQTFRMLEVTHLEKRREKREKKKWKWQLEVIQQLIEALKIKFIRSDSRVLLFTLQ